MLFLVDAQLPPALAEALRQAGSSAIHVAEIGLLTASDEEIWDEAASRSAILVTKDRDFLQLRAAKADGPTILWIRVGNKNNRTLIAQILRALPAIIGAVERGEAVIEFVSRRMRAEGKRRNALRYSALQARWIVKDSMELASKSLADGSMRFVRSSLEGRLRENSTRM